MVDGLTVTFSVTVSTLRQKVEWVRPSQYSERHLVLQGATAAKARKPVYRGLAQLWEQHNNDHESFMAEVLQLVPKIGLLSPYDPLRGDTSSTWQDAAGEVWVWLKVLDYLGSLERRKQPIPKRGPPDEVTGLQNAPLSEAIMHRVGDHLVTHRRKLTKAEKEHFALAKGIKPTWFKEKKLKSQSGLYYTGITIAQSLQDEILVEKDTSGRWCDVTSVAKARRLIASYLKRQGMKAVLTAMERSYKPSTSIYYIGALDYARLELAEVFTSGSARVCTWCGAPIDPARRAGTEYCPGKKCLMLHRRHPTEGLRPYGSRGREKA